MFNDRMTNSYLLWDRQYTMLQLLHKHDSCKDLKNFMLK